MDIQEALGTVVTASLAQQRADVPLKHAVRCGVQLPTEFSPLALLCSHSKPYENSMNSSVRSQMMMIDDDD